MKYIIANWKMNFDINEVHQWVEKFLALKKDQKFKNKIILAAPHTHLSQLKQWLYNTDIKISAQNVSPHDKGAHTGEIGAFDLKDYANYCICGHSERNEKKEEIIQKVQQCQKFVITPVLCFPDLKFIDQTYEGVILCWEDPKNISKNGVYQNKPTEQIAEMFDHFKKLNIKNPILYGGSVHSGNITQLAGIANLSGVLVGNASLDPNTFLEIISAFE